jgi:CRISPR system Cascade subunit CasA
VSDPPRFDLRDEPWVPVVDLAGHPVELGLRAVLCRAHELAAITDASPLVEVALFRLLLAILHRAVSGPRTPEAWGGLWAAGRLDDGWIDHYLDTVGDRLDLFGPARPFYQERGLLAAGIGARPIARLTHDLASDGNSALLFDQTLEAALPPALAARVLIAHQAFALGGLITPPPGSRDKSSVDAPIARAAVFRVRGGSLFESLLANLHRYDPGNGVPVAGLAADLPAWERDTPADGSTRQPTGYLDMLTWQSRRVELAMPADGLVREVAILSGDRLPPERSLTDLEPTMLAFVPARRPGRADEVREVRLSPTRALWRDSTAILGTTRPVGHARRPGVVGWVAEVAGGDPAIPGGAGIVPLDVAGLVADQAKTVLWRRETLPVVASALRDTAVAEQLAEAVRRAERVGAMLGDGDPGPDERSFPRPMARLAIRLLGTATRRPESKAIHAFVEASGASRRYWGALGAPFGELVQSLAAADTASDPVIARAEAVRRWTAVVRSAARDAFTRASSGYGRSPRELIAVADAERALTGGLAMVLGSPSERQEVALR